jgi:predicted Zn-dependent peptidase
VFYERTVLDSGVTVLTERMDAVRSVAMGIWFAAGSRDEDPAVAGMAHFLEHMMFKGTEKRSAAEISETFDRMGAELNAFTSKEYTCYYSRFVDDHLEDAVEALSDMLCGSRLADDACDSEREVVIEEISRHEDSPDEHVHELFAEALWGSHPLGRPVLGSRETVGGFDGRRSRTFKESLYTGPNCAVVAAGSVDHARLVGLVSEYLSLAGGHDRGRPDEASSPPEPLRVLTKDTEQAHICLGVEGLPSGHDERFSLSVLDSILGGGMSSRLFQEIREKHGLAYAVFTYHSMHQETGSLTAYVGTRPDNVEQVVGLLREQVDKLVADGVTAEELHRSKESLKGSLVLGLENTRNRMTRLGKSEVTHGQLLSIDELISRVDSVTSADVHEMARRLFGGPSVLTVIGPLEADALAHLA